MQTTSLLVAFGHQLASLAHSASMYNQTSNMSISDSNNIGILQLANNIDKAIQKYEKMNAGKNVINKKSDIDANVTPIEDYGSRYIYTQNVTAKADSNDVHELLTKTEKITAKNTNSRAKSKRPKRKAKRKKKMQNTQEQTNKKAQNMLDNFFVTSITYMWQYEEQRAMLDEAARCNHHGKESCDIQLERVMWRTTKYKDLWVAPISHYVTDSCECLLGAAGVDNLSFGTFCSFTMPNAFQNEFASLDFDNYLRSKACLQKTKLPVRKTEADKFAKSLQHDIFACLNHIKDKDKKNKDTIYIAAQYRSHGPMTLTIHYKNKASVYYLYKKLRLGTTKIQTIKEALQEIDKNIERITRN